MSWYPNDRRRTLPGTSVITIERFIIEQERLFPEATGELSNLLYDIALGAKIIAATVRRAGILQVFGTAGHTNVTGDVQQRLDVFANEALKNAMGHTGRVCVMASEEDEEVVTMDGNGPRGKYAVLFDPLDGSSNIDNNNPVGTIFSIYRRRTMEGDGTLEDVLQPGRDQVAAGYVMYGSSVMMVYSTGQGVHGFTLDPTIGEFVLSHPDIRTPEVGRYYSVNESYFARWSPAMKQAVRGFHGDLPDRIKGKNSRYIGALVADFHRNLVSGGIFLYPGEVTRPEGKLRLCYEATPLAFIIEHAGGAATDGQKRILDIVPTELHQRTPLVIGSKKDVEFVGEILRENQSTV